MYHYQLENGMLTLPPDMTILQAETFAENMDITKVICPGTLVEIGGAAFAGCENLKEVLFPEGNYLRQIGDGAFTLCGKLQEYPFGEKLETIGEMAFYETALVRVVLGNSVSFLGDSAFWGCRSMKNFRVLNPKCNIGTEVIGDCPSLVDGFVAAGYPSSAIYNQVDELDYTLLYFSHREGHLSATKERAEAFARTQEMLLMEKIIKNNNTSAMTGLMEAKLIQQSNIDLYLKQAGDAGLPEIVNLLLETKKSTHTTIDFGALEL